MTTATPTAETIVEQFSNGVFLSEAKINGNVITNVCLCGLTSKNGRRYLSTAFGPNASVYEGRPVFVDHNEGAPFARSVRDFAGNVTNPRMQNGKPYGDIKLAETDASKLLVSVVKAAAGDIGLSHSARGTFSDKSRTVVESLEEVVSVDVVMFPATTRNFSEQTNFDDINDVAELKTLLAKAIAERDTAFAKLNGETQELQVYRECRDAGLDIHNPSHMVEWFVNVLKQQPSAERRKAIIDDRVAMFKAAAQYRSDGGVITIERTHGGPQPASLKAEVDRVFGCPLQNEVDRVFGNGSAEIADDVSRAFGA